MVLGSFFKIKFVFLFVVCYFHVIIIHGHPGGDYAGARNLCPLQCGDGYKCEPQPNRRSFQCVFTRYEVNPPFSPMSSLTGQSIYPDQLQSVVHSAVKSLVKQATESLSPFNDRSGGHSISVSVQRVRVPLTDGGINEEHLEGQHFGSAGGVETFVQNIPLLPPAMDGKSSSWSKGSQSFGTVAQTPPAPTVQFPTTLSPEVSNSQQQQSQPFNSDSNSGWPFNTPFLDSFRSMFDGQNQQGNFNQFNMQFGDMSKFDKTGLWQKMNSFFDSSLNNGPMFSQNSFQSGVQPDLGSRQQVQQLPKAPTPAEVVSKTADIRPTDIQSLDVKQKQPIINEMSTIEQFKRLNNMGEQTQTTLQPTFVKPPRNNNHDQMSNSLHPSVPRVPSNIPVVNNPRRIPVEVRPSRQTPTQSNTPGTFHGMGNALPAPPTSIDNVNMFNPNTIQNAHTNTNLNTQSNWETQTQPKLVGSEFGQMGQSGPLSNNQLQRPQSKQDRRITGALKEIRNRMSMIPWNGESRNPASTTNTPRAVAPPSTQRVPLVGGGPQCKSCNTNDDCTGGRNHYCYYSPECAIKICQTL